MPWPRLRGHVAVFAGKHAHGKRGHGTQHATPNLNTALIAEPMRELVHTHRKPLGPCRGVAVGRIGIGRRQEPRARACAAALGRVEQAIAKINVSTAKQATALRRMPVRAKMRRHRLATA